MHRLAFSLVLAASCTVGSVVGAQPREAQAEGDLLAGPARSDESLATSSVLPPERRSDAPNLLRQIGIDRTNRSA